MCWCVEGKDLFLSRGALLSSSWVKGKGHPVSGESMTDRAVLPPCSPASPLNLRPGGPWPSWAPPPHPRAALLWEFQVSALARVTAVYEGGAAGGS